MFHQIKQLARASSMLRRNFAIDKHGPKTEERDLPSSDWITNEKDFPPGMSRVDYIYKALERMKELGIERDLEAYKDLFRIFPPGRYHKRYEYDFGLFHAPQQMCGLRILLQMDLNNVKPDKELEKLVELAFSKHSDVWLKTVRSNYWSMKGRNVDANPLPEKLPTEPHELAAVALKRMVDDVRAKVVVTSTETIPEAVDKTWVAYCQSPAQRSILDRLKADSILRVVDCGITYVDRAFLSYYALRVYDDEETSKKWKPREPNHNYNRLKFKFYGKTIEEKFLEPEIPYRVDNGFVLAVGMTGTSSSDSIASWLKILQTTNPNLGKLNVIFDLSHSSASQDSNSKIDGDQDSS